MYGPTTERIDLPIDGMSCAACASKIERTLNSLEGVEATVNYATEQATVRFDPVTVAPGDLVGAVEAAGYHARMPAAGSRRSAAHAGAHRRDALAAGAAGLDDPVAAVRLLAVGRAAARDAGRPLGGLAVPPRGLAGACVMARPRWTR